MQVDPHIYPEILMEQLGCFQNPIIRTADLRNDLRPKTGGNGCNLSVLLV